MMQTYELLEGTSRSMLDAARNAEWRRLASLERDCRKLIENLPDDDDDGLYLDDIQLRRKHEIIHRILADDAEIRDLVEPWMARARQFLTSLALERKLRQSYPRSRSP
ncbi:MAG: flagellar protein FliT [Georgfuchsia sp.]